ncbi:MAG: heme o synthase [Parachlamydiales bacterium]
MIKYYAMMTKPGILAGNLLTTTAGFMLATEGPFNLPHYLITLAGLGLVIASACVFNNALDRHADQKMERTKNRALAKGLISPRSASLFATALGLIGFAILTLFTNRITLLLALGGFLIYVLLYTLGKYRSPYSTHVGSLAGAVPPLVGYTTLSGHLDLAALLLLTLMALWQMPHFYAIAMYRVDDYAAASIPVLPVKRGMRATKIQIIIYTIAFAAASSFFFSFGYRGYPYLIVAVALGIGWVALALLGLKAPDDKRWARQIFIFSLATIVALSATITFSH